MQSLFSNDSVATVQSNRILYTPSEFAKESLLYLQEIGSLVAKRAHVSKRNKLDSYLFFIVRKGRGELVFDGTRYALEAGDCVFIDCRRSYSHSTDPENLWELAWIHFQGSIMQGIYEKYIERGGQPVFRITDVGRINEIWQQIFEVAGSADYIRDMKINEGLNSLLTILMNYSWNREAQENAKQSGKRNLTDVRRFLDEHFAEHITLDKLAEDFYINKFYLTRVFREQYGVTINNYLLQLRITKAKQLLRFTDEKIEEIGFDCGLGAATYFSRAFKQVEGISPREYRMKWSGR